MARVQAGENLAEVALELGVDRRGLARWQEWLDPEMLRTDRAAGEGAGDGSGAVEEGASREGSFFYLLYGRVKVSP